MCLDESHNILLVNTILEKNSAMFGAGASCRGSSCRLLHTTAVSNTGDSAILVGWGSDNSMSSAWLTNTLIAGHSVGVDVSDYTTATLNSVLWHQTPVTLSASISATVSVTNEINADPRFADLAGGDYHLQAGSPAINRGVWSGELYDFDGAPRDLWPDLGAYEFPLMRVLLPLIFRP